MKKPSKTVHKMSKNNPKLFAQICDIENMSEFDPNTAKNLYLSGCAEGLTFWGEDELQACLEESKIDDASLQVKLDREFTPFYYKLSDRNSEFIAAHDPKIKDRQDQQQLTFSDVQFFMQKMRNWQGEFTYHPLTASLQNHAALKNPESFKAWLRNAEYAEIFAAKSALATFAQVEDPLINAPALRFDDAKDGKPVYFAEKAKVRDKVWLGAMDELRIFGKMQWFYGSEQNIIQDESLEYNARMLLEDKNGAWHMYALDQKLYLNDLVDHESPMHFTRLHLPDGADFRPIELWLSDGNVLERARKVPRKNTKQFHVQTNYAGASWEPGARFRPNVIWQKRAGKYMDQSLVQAHAYGAKALMRLDISTLLVALANPKFSAKILKRLRGDDGTLSLALFDPKNAQQNLNSLQAYSSVPKKYRVQKIMSFMRQASVKAPKKLAEVVAVLKKRDELNDLILFVNGYERMELIRILARTVSFQVDMPWYDDLRQVASHGLGPAARVASIFLHPLETCAAIAKLANWGAIALTDGYIASKDGETFVRASHAFDSYVSREFGEVGSNADAAADLDYEGLNSVRAGARVVGEILALLALIKTINTAPGMLYRGALYFTPTRFTIPFVTAVDFLSAAARRLAFGGLGTYTGMHVGSAIYGSMIFDETLQYKPFEEELVLAIEEVQRDVGDGWTQTSTWIRDYIIGRPNRALSEYEHWQRAYRDYRDPLFKKSGLSGVSFMKGIYDPSGKFAKIWWMLGVERFQELHTPKYVYQITQNIKKIAKKHTKSSRDKRTLIVRKEFDKKSFEAEVNGLVRERAQLIMYLDPKTLDISKVGPLARLGINWGGVDFTRLYAYLKAEGF